MRDDTKNSCVADYEERRKKIGERSEGEKWPLSLLRLPIRLYTVHSIFWHFFPTVKAGPRLALHLGISLGGYREKSIE